MNKVYFNVYNFPRFVEESSTSNEPTWHGDFVRYGYKTHVQHISSVKGKHLHSLSEEEYTWFVLRWS